MNLNHKKDLLGDRRFTLLCLCVIFFSLAGKGIDLNQHTWPYETIQEIDFHPAPVYINIIKVEKPSSLDNEEDIKI